MHKYFCKKCDIEHLNPNDCPFVKQKQKINGKALVKYMHGYFCNLCNVQHKNANECPAVLAQKSRNRLNRTWISMHGNEKAIEMKLNQGEIAKERFTGKPKPLEQRKKMSKSASGKIRPKTHCLNISQGRKKFWDEHPEEREKTRKFLLTLSSPRQGTTIEKKIRMQLDFYNIIYIKNSPKILGRPDIYIVEYNLAIFADGCYPHYCQICNLVPDNDKPKNIGARTQYHRDYFIQKILEEQGHTVIRIYEHDINRKDFDILDCLPIQFKILAAYNQAKILINVHPLSL